MSGCCAGSSRSWPTSAGLLDHLPDPRATLVEWARVSAPDAVLLLAGGQRDGDTKPSS
ncbi:MULTISPECIES: hypothetical protein [Streptomyces]|uniref:hypothetical protein n=1 Tax=Streptomyces TaxID=1883 RepID=UPI001CC232FD|nr:hypothetical protein [Streptomyces venezuelae]